MDKKAKAIEALDEALDSEIIFYAERFADAPNTRDLKMLCDLVTVDMYADKYLDGMATVKPSVGTIPR